MVAKLGRMLRKLGRRLKAKAPKGDEPGPPVKDTMGDSGGQGSAGEGDRYILQMGSNRAKKSLASRLGMKLGGSKDKMELEKLRKENARLKKNVDELSSRMGRLADSEKRKLSEVQEKNQQWVVYDQQREAYVQEYYQQWLVYDQQREAYVQALLAGTFGLEQQPKQENHGADSGDTTLAQKQEYYDKLLLTAKMDLEAQKEQVVQAQGELRAERTRGRQAERQADTLKAELETVRARLEKERQRSTGLICQVNVLQKSLLNQHEDQKRIALLEQQIQASTRDFENEKLDHQTLQQLLQKVMRELRKARGQITRLESTVSPVPIDTRLAGDLLSETLMGFLPPPKQQRGSLFTALEFDKLSVQDPAPARSSISRIPNLVDEPFLECPICHREQCPVSHHRELLAHIEDCSSVIF